MLFFFANNPTKAAHVDVYTWAGFFPFKLLNQRGVVVVHVDGDDVVQCADLFRGTPRSSSQPFNIVSHHRQGVIDAEQWIVSNTFKLTLSG